ncbi:MAG: hypothetical protein MUC65_10415 [Pontiellaceae bacterium]|nr:hypothetical protein [Pontiellaceae bacterium]
MVKLIRETNKIYLLATAVMLAAAFAGCKRKPSESAAVQSNRPVSSLTSEKVNQSDSNYVPRISSGCTEADTDENGQTSEEEAAAYYKSELEANRKKINGHNLVMMQTYDTNRDGKLEKSELGKYLLLRNYLLKPGLSKGCTMADTDENGQTSEEEAAAYYESKLEKYREKLNNHNLMMIEIYDLNKDGKLEKSELSDYFKFRDHLLDKIKIQGGQTQ